MNHIAMIAQPIQRIPPTSAAAVEWWMWQVARQLARSGRYVPHIICTGEGDPSPEYEERDGVHFYRITLSRTYKRVFQKWTRLDPFGYAARAARYVRKAGIDVVHTHNSPDLHMQLTKYLGRQRGILHMHNEKQPPAHFRADRLLAVSEYLAGWYRARVPGTDVRVITNGIDRQAYACGGPPAEWKTALPQDGQVILFAGRISPEKGLHILAEAFALLAPKRPDLRLVIIGGRSFGENDRARYADQVEAALKPFARQVLWLGSVHPEEMPRHYRAADLLVVPSVFEEPFGMVCLEGMAAGVPVLAARKGGLPEFVENGANGYLIDAPGDASSLAGQIERILAFPEASGKIAEEAIRYAHSNHDWSLIAARLSAIYDELIP